MRSSAGPDPVARAKGAMPVARMTLNGPSTRILVKPVIPKLRVAAPAGAANAMIEAAIRKVRMGPPSYGKFKAALRAADHEQRTLPDPALLMLHLAPPVTLTSPEPITST